MSQDNADRILSCVPVHYSQLLASPLFRVGGDAAVGPGTAGVYVLYEDDDTHGDGLRPVYVGQSEDIARRLRVHTDPYHESASLAHRIGNAYYMDARGKGTDEPSFGQALVCGADRVKRMWARYVSVESSDKRLMLHGYASISLVMGPVPDTDYTDEDKHDDKPFHPGKSHP